MGAFGAMPSVPTIAQHGAMVFTTNHKAGMLRAIPGLATARSLPSYQGNFNDGAFVGKLLPLTAGHTPCWIFLASKDKAVVDADYDRLINIENADAFYDVAPTTGPVSLTALDHDLRVQWLPVIAAMAFLLVAAIAARPQKMESSEGFLPVTLTWRTHVNAVLVFTRFLLSYLAS